MSELNNNKVNSTSAENQEYVGRYEKRNPEEQPLRPLKPVRRAVNQNTASEKPKVKPVSHFKEIEDPQKRRIAEKKLKRQNAEIRRRKKKERRQKKITNAIAGINVAALGGLLVCGAVYMFALEHETIANDENRYLAKFPEFSVESYFDGEYTEGIANYYDDTVPNRSLIKQFITKSIMPLKGRKYGDDGVELHGIAFENRNEVTTAVTTTTAPAISLIGTTMTGDVTTTVTTTAPPPIEDNPAADGEMTNNILIANNRGINIYGGGWGLEKEYARFVNDYKKSLPTVNVYSLTAPTAGSFYTPENYKDLFSSEKDDFDSIAEELVDVFQVDAYSALLAHKNEDIYSRTDHHWQPLGAYYAAQAFAQVAGVEFPDIKEYQKVILHDYVGTLYGYTQSATLLNNPENFIYYKPKTELTVTQYDKYFQNPVETSLFLDTTNMDKSSYYLVFGMDDRIVHVNTSCKNGRNLIIFKDSYGNAMLPVLTGSFENIYLCDIRYFEINPISFAINVDCTDMLFAMCSFSAVGPNRNYINTNYHK